MKVYRKTKWVWMWAFKNLETQIWQPISKRSRMKTSVAGSIKREILLEFCFDSLKDNFEVTVQKCEIPEKSYFFDDMKYTIKLESKIDKSASDFRILERTYSKQLSRIPSSEQSPSRILWWTFFALFSELFSIRSDQSDRTHAIREEIWNGNIFAKVVQRKRSIF